MKCFIETEIFSLITGTYKNKKSISFNITFSSKRKKIKIPQNSLNLKEKKKKTLALLGFSFKPTKMSAIQLEEMKKPLTIVFHSPLLQEIISENLSYQEF